MYVWQSLCQVLLVDVLIFLLLQLNDCLNGATHGPVHIMIGGAWGDNTVFNDVEYVRKPSKLLFFKVLWRMGWTRCPTSCDSTDYDSCRCSVPQEYIDTYGAKEILESANITYALAAQIASLSYTDADYVTLLRSVEDPGIVGDFYSSAAAFDPIFWPLHGAAERLAALKRIYISMGETAEWDPKWQFTAYSKYSPAAYLNGVCDWSAVGDSYTDLTLPSCTLGEQCYGHHEDDILEFHSFVANETYTNVEFFDFMHPWTESLPYVYDTFDFDYCADVGEAFDPYAVASDDIAPAAVMKEMNSAANTAINVAAATADGANVVPDSVTGPLTTTAGVRPPPSVSSSSATITSTSKKSSRGKSRGPNILIDKDSIETVAVKHNAAQAARAKSDIPLDLLNENNGIVTYASLQAYSESRRRRQ
jgi:hypothetical protein